MTRLSRALLLLVGVGLATVFGTGKCISSSWTDLFRLLRSLCPFTSHP